MSAFLFNCSAMGHYLAKNPTMAKITITPQTASLDAGTPFKEGLMPESPPDLMLPDEDDERPLAREAAPIRKPANRPNICAVTLMFGCRKVIMTPMIVMVRMICEFSLDKSSFRKTRIAAK